MTAQRGDLTFLVANFLGRGEEYETSCGRKTLTLIRTRLAGTKVEIRQDPEVLFDSKADYRGRFVETTRIVVRNVRMSNPRPARRLVEDVCWLLTLASMSRVVPHGFEDPPGELRQSWIAFGAVGRSWQLIPLAPGSYVRTFLEQTFKPFRALPRARITACIDVLYYAEQDIVPTEVRMVLVYVCLEMLKDMWARQRKIQFAKGVFCKANLKGKPVKYTFEELLLDMCRDVGMRPSLKRLVRYRNALIHSGGIRIPEKVKQNAYLSAQRLAREYLLRLLGYRGPYFRFREMKLRQL